MTRPDCEKCPSLDPSNRFDPRFPAFCPFGPAGSIKLLGNVCPVKLGIEEIRKECTNFALVVGGNNVDPSSLPCLAGGDWQEKNLAGRKTCMVRTLGDLRLCFGYKPR